MKSAFEARRLAYPALERLGPVLTEDVCVPRSRVPLQAAVRQALDPREIFNPGKN